MSGGTAMRIFVAHDFSNPPLRNYRAAFKRVEQKHQIDFVFADEIHAADHLLEQIEDMIVGADACLFDLTTANHNVFLELGFARGKGKSLYLLFRPARGILWKLGFVQGFSDVPTGIRGQRVLHYRSSRSLALQLDDLVKGLIQEPDLSGLQGMQAARIEEQLSRHPGGLLIGDITTGVNLDQAMVRAVLQLLISQGRVVATTEAADSVGRRPYYAARGIMSVPGHGDQRVADGKAN